MLNGAYGIIAWYFCVTFNYQTFLSFMLVVEMVHCLLSLLLGVFVPHR